MAKNGRVSSFKDGLHLADGVHLRKCQRISEGLYYTTLLLKYA